MEWGYGCTIEHVSFLWEASSKSEFKAVTNILHVTEEKIKATVGNEGSVQTSLIVLLRSRNSEGSSKEGCPRAVFHGTLKCCFELDL